LPLLDRSPPDMPASRRLDLGQNLSTSPPNYYFNGLLGVDKVNASTQWMVCRIYVTDAG